IVLPLARPVKNAKIADVGTGSGALALALAKELPGAEIHATDNSPAALEIAEANADRLQLEFRPNKHEPERRLFFHDTNLLNGLEANVFDFVVSTPPYAGEPARDGVKLQGRNFNRGHAV